LSEDVTDRRRVCSIFFSNACRSGALLSVIRKRRANDQRVQLSDCYSDGFNSPAIQPVACCAGSGTSHSHRQPHLAHSKNSRMNPFIDPGITRACLESARAPDAFVGKADVPAAGNAADLFVLVPTCLALTDRVAANFEAGCLVAAGCFALAFVMRISGVAGHPSRPTAAAAQWPKAGGARY
jgi:hypothetical protein